MATMRASVNNRNIILLVPKAVDCSPFEKGIKQSLPSDISTKGSLVEDQTTESLAVVSRKRSWNVMNEKKIRDVHLHGPKENLKKFRQSKSSHRASRKQAFSFAGRSHAHKVCVKNGPCKHSHDNVFSASRYRSCSGGDFMKRGKYGDGNLFVVKAKAGRRLVQKEKDDKWCCLRRESPRFREQKNHNFKILEHPAHNTDNWASLRGIQCNQALKV